MHSSSSRKAAAAQRLPFSEPTPRIRSHKERFVSTRLSDRADSRPIEQLLQRAADLAPVATLVKDSTITDDKLERINALHARWRYEDIEGPLDGSLDRDALKARRHNRCREIGLIVFGFTSLHAAQVDAICTLCYEQRDLLFLAKTGFGKSLIFQLLPFITPTAGVVLVLMPLKLLQAE